MIEWIAANNTLFQVIFIAAVSVVAVLLARGESAKGKDKVISVLLVAIAVILSFQMVYSANEYVNAKDLSEHYVDKGDYIVFEEGGRVEISCKTTGWDEVMYLHGPEEPCRAKSIDGEPSGWFMSDISIDGEKFYIVSKDDKERWYEASRQFHGIDK